VIYEVEINGRMRRVEVERAHESFVVTVDGRQHLADVTSINGAFSLILGPAGVGPHENGIRRSYEIAIAEDPPASGNLTIHVNGRVVAASVGASRGSWARRGHEAGGPGKGPQTVTAPMPGKVVKVLVKSGDAVTARQGVIVVEAMKMENELHAPKAGTVTDIKVVEGASVEAGATLIVID
jgi:biotin carboxyl carrier protein